MFKPVKVHKFNIGDKVQLKSGGPAMMVVQASQFNPFVICNWFLGNSFHSQGFNHLMIDYFQEDELPPIVLGLPSKLQK